MDQILIVDDHPLVIEAIGAAISTAANIEIISAASADEMRKLLASAKLNNRSIRAVFLDLQLPDANGIDLIYEVSANFGIPVVAMSGNDDDLTVDACKKNGAIGFVGKASKLSSFNSALTAVIAGGQYFPIDRINGKNLIPINILASLNSRQRQLFDLVVKGKSNKQIGKELFLAEGTVKNRVSELLKIFDAESRTQILFAASQLGYKPSSSPPAPSKTTTIAGGPAGPIPCRKLAPG
ncbi:response regulator transcription factor [Massilia sp. erpn]|uniref:response regulator transcription factor n=1 Tax=Massilia sp. erpn TaxID=2738142 RepID=UPI002105D606|nr:response regulator transcription factor [Massilia sp. erpn]UTY59273.1 response regulator transcription factor [Massilia sp. erpn]